MKLKGDEIYFMDIYRLKYEYTYMRRNGLIFNKYKEEKYWRESYHPILANSPEDAIKKYRELLSLDDNIKVEIMSMNDFNFNELKEELKADEFMIYYKDRLGLDKLVEKLIK